MYDHKQQQYGYGHSGASQQSYGSTSPSSYYPSPPVSPNTARHTRPGNGYQPVSFDSPGNGGVSSDAFYSTLVDSSTGRPSEVFARFADALFFAIDGQCDMAGYRGTGCIEPRKYAWMLRRFGEDEEGIEAGLMALQDYYLMAQVPFSLVNIQGSMQPVLDRRGWLHLLTFDARATPNDAHRDMSKALAVFALTDPASGIPFPTPLPRTAFPFLPEPTLASAHARWATNAVISAARARSQASTTAMLAAAGLGGAGLGAYGANSGAGAGAADYLSAMQASQSQSNAMLAQTLAQSQANSSALYQQMMSNSSAQYQQMMSNSIGGGGGGGGGTGTGGLLTQAVTGAMGGSPGGSGLGTAVSLFGTLMGFPGLS